jgi:hypothetical protein
MTVTFYTNASSRGNPNNATLRLGCPLGLASWRFVVVFQPLDLVFHDTTDQLFGKALFMAAVVPQDLFRFPRLVEISLRAFTWDDFVMQSVLEQERTR